MEEILIEGIIAALANPQVRGELAALYWDIIRKKADPAYDEQIKGLLAQHDAAKTEEEKDAANLAIHDLLKLR